MTIEYQRAKRKAPAMLRIRRKQGIYYFLNHSINDLVVCGWENLIGLSIWLHKRLPFYFILSPLLYIVWYPFTLVYFFYISLPLSVFRFFWTFVIEVVHTLSRRSSHTRQMAIHMSALGGSLKRIGDSVINTKISEMLLTILQVIFEVFSSWTYSRTKDSKDMNLSIRELSELVSYEELDDDSVEMDHTAQHRMHSLMHHYVPPNPFRAVTRASHAPPTGYEAIDEADSPASFPPTPFSRARVMSHSTERVVSTMFAARDRLRIEAQSVSRDEYSRKAAVEAQTSGQMAVFDARQTSDGIALTCGNHCALKVGRSLCCSSRAMIPIRLNNFVYIEFSVTAQSGQIPSLAIGLAPPDSPLNVMVGSWPQSMGLYADGQLLIGSRWFPGNGNIIEAGSTVGILTYLPGSTGKERKKRPFDGSQMDGQTQTPIESQVGYQGSQAVSEATTPVSCSSPEFSVPMPFTMNISVDGRSSKLAHDTKEAAGAVASVSPVLYPTVSLLSQDTRVWCRFCEADIVYRSRATLGAPPGVRVYCLDGSLLLNEESE